MLFTKDHFIFLEKRLQTESSPNDESEKTESEAKRKCWFIFQIVNILKFFVLFLATAERISYLPIKKISVIENIEIWNCRIYKKYIFFCSTILGLA